MNLSGLLPKLLAGAVIAYAAACLGLYIIQDRMIFFPDTTPAGDPPYEGVRQLAYETEDGASITAWYAEASAGCPTFIFLHGNGTHIAQDTARYAPMLEMGTGFLAVSWPGYAGSDGAPGEPAFRKAADASADWLLASGVEPADIIIHGDSIGSGPATRLASERQFGALVLEEPYFSLRDLVGQKVPFMPIGLILKSTFRSDLWIGDVKTPLLIVHGDADTLIPQSQSRRLFELANEPKTYESLPGAQHSTLVEAGLYDRIWPFLAANWSPADGSVSCFTASSNSSETTL